ncbi:ribonuclease D [Thalassospira xiamenensis]|nr:ribonuclease D [Thalassospira xiamenensis]
MTLITDQQALVGFCAHVQQQKQLAVDTEFVRTRTLFARLGLIQARSTEQLVLIDPLADLDLQPFWALITDPSVVTVIHAGGEDYEIFWQQIGSLPANLFDTQIAAAFVGLGDALGYAALVQQHFDVELDKSQSRTDWLKRPLTSAQLDYAAADVEYLHDIYPQLNEKVEAAGVASLVRAESQFQAQKRAQQIPADLLYLFYGNAWQLTRSQLAVLKVLAAWRQQRAESENIPLGFVGKEHVFIELARKQPTRKEHLYNITDLAPPTRKYAGDEILSAVATGLAVPESEYPASLYRLTDMPGYKATFNALKKVITACAETHGIPVSMIASRRQINDLLHWVWQIPPEFYPRLPQPDLLTSWRGDMLKESLLTILKRS